MKNTSSVTSLLHLGYLFEFRRIFDVYYYHRTIVCKDGIGYQRMCAIVKHPEKMTISELIIIADHFEVPRETVLKMISLQLSGFGIDKYLRPDGTIT